MAEVIRTLETIKADLEAAVKDYNEALEEDSAFKIASSDKRCKELTSEYRRAALKWRYTELRNMEASEIMMAVVNSPYVSTLVCADEKDDNGSVVSRTIESKDVQLDILELKKFCGVEKPFGNDKKWSDSLQLLNQLLCLRAGKDLKLTSGELKSISASFYMERNLAAMQDGKTPCSNTALLKALCSLFSEMFGSAVAKPRSQDIAYLIAATTKAGKKALSLKVSKNADFGKLVVLIANGMVNGGKAGATYSLEYAVRKAKK